MVVNIASIEHYVNRDKDILSSLNRYYGYAMGGYKTQAVLAERRGDASAERKWKDIAKYIGKQRDMIREQLDNTHQFINEVQTKKPRVKDIAKGLEELSETQSEVLSVMKSRMIAGFPKRDKWINTLNWHQSRIDFVNDRADIIQKLEEPLNITVFVYKASPTPYHKYTIQARDIRELRDKLQDAKQSVRMRFGNIPIHNKVDADRLIAKGRNVEYKQNKHGEWFWLYHKWDERKWSEIEKTIKIHYKSDSDEKERNDFEELHTKYRRKRR